MNLFVEDTDDGDGQDRDIWGACKKGYTDAVAGGQVCEGFAGSIGDSELREDHFNIAGMILYDGTRRVG